MKKLFGLTIIFILVSVLIGCVENNETTTMVSSTTTNQITTTKEQPVDLEYGFLLESIWEKYLIEAFWSDELDIESVDEFIILGIYTYNKDLGEYSDRFYIGDERISYSFDIIITYDEESDIRFHHYKYQYSDMTFYGSRNISGIGYLEMVDSDDILDNYIALVKASLIETKQTQDEHFLSLMSEESIYESELIEDRYEIEDIEHYLPNILDIHISDSIIYMIAEEDVSVVGYKTDESFPDLVIASEIEGLPVTEIYESAFRDAEINSLEIPSSIAEIGYESFVYATVLNITFVGDSQLVFIGAKAFHSSFFREIVIPISVERIDQNAFSRISNLSSIYVEATEKPIGWSDYWIDDHSVQWGYLDNQ